jgi:hypothetical protein
MLVIQRYVDELVINTKIPKEAVSHRGARFELSKV